MLQLNHRCEATRRQLAVVTLTCLVGLLGVVGLPSEGLAADKLPADAASASTQPQADATRVAVDGAWIRPTVKGQTATGGYMTLTATEALTLIGFSTSVAEETELHEMVMDGNVMRMRAIDALALPAGQAVTMKPGPGAKHLMLMGLKRQIKAGEVIQLTLQLRDAGGKAFTQAITVPVRTGVASGAAMVPEGTHPAGHRH